MKVTRRPKTPEIPAPTRRKRSRKRRRETPAEIILSPGQIKALDVIRFGKSLFLTGGAGTGKSFALIRIIAALRNRLSNEKLSVAVGASTGVAALNVKGSTIHSLLGTKICGNLLEGGARLRKLRRESDGDPWAIERRDSLPRIKKRLDRWGALVIDEVPMLTGDYIDMMDWWLREVRGKDEPFGGVQIIFCGDFLQLPPVIKPGNRVVSRFGFQSSAWAEAALEIVTLRKVHRQDDRVFVEHLKRLRFGELPEETKIYFDECVGREFDIEPTRLFSTNKEVDQLNRRMLNRIPGKEMEYVARIKAPTPELRKRLLKDAFVKERIALRVGADVILARNKYEEEGGGRKVYVNGDRGVVTEMTDKSVYVRLLRNGEEERIGFEEWSLERTEPDGTRKKLASMMQLPIKLAWAVSIHKAQGQSLDPVEADLDRCFERGQAYVAISRAREYTGLRLVGELQERHVMVHEECAEFHRRVEG